MMAKKRLEELIHAYKYGVQPCLVPRGTEYIFNALLAKDQRTRKM